MQITLDQLAKTNDGKEHVVIIKPSTSDMESFRGRPILQIQGTGGSWYLSTFFEGTERDLPCQGVIDFGRNYYVVNFRAILMEAVYKLATRPLLNPDTRRPF
jgi:hypothetical protein